MYFKVESSGCCEHRGKVQIRYCMYLEKDDYGYEKHKISDGTINPFHNHFCYFDASVTDEEILFVGELAIREARKQWDMDIRPDVKNVPVQFIDSLIGMDDKESCINRIAQIKSKVIQSDPIKAVK